MARSFLKIHYWLLALLFLLAPLPALYGQACTINSNFNGTSIAGGDYIWFTGVLNVHGLGSQPVTLLFTNSTITFTVNGVQQSYNVPNAELNFSSTITQATTSYNPSTNTWTTNLPSSGLAGNDYLTGVAVKVPAGGWPGGVQPVTWTGTFESNTTGLGVQWQWGAAVYTQFTTSYSSLGVKPVDDNQKSQYQNSDHAGTPENYKPYVIGGATGGGGSNWTGSYSGTGSCTIIPVPTLNVRCPSVSTGTVGQSYTSSLTATGGMAPYTFSISSGSLPPGLSLNAATGAITGTPTTAGTYNYTAKVTDSTGAFVTTSCSIVVSPPALTLTCASGSAQVGVAYSSALVAAGGAPPYTFSISSGSLPPGLTLNSSTGAISGTPTTAGTYSYTTKVTDSTGEFVTTQCSITVAPAALALACASGTAQVGQPYSSALVATGGVSPYSFSISRGSLPPGLTLNSSTGAISGTPTTAGTYNYTAKVTDSTGAFVTTSCSIVVSPPQLTLACASGSAQVGVAYSSALVAVGGVPPYTFSISSGSLPPGLTLNSSTGAITGTPTTAGTYSYTAKVTDSTGAFVTTQCSITVAPAALTLACASGTAEVGQSYSSALAAAGGVPPYTFSISSGSLPPGLTLNSSTGAITGTPTTAGTYSYTAKVTDSTGAFVTTSCSIVVSPPELTLACASGSAQVGVPYSSALVAADGVPPYTFSISSGSLPPGLTLNSSTGAITGTPSTAGTYDYTAEVTDSTGAFVTTSCSIVVSPPQLTLACPSGTAQVGVPYSSALVAAGGVPPYTFSISSGSLPPGLSLDPSTGAITGTPTTPGNYSYSADVQDSAGNSTTVSCRINVVPTQQPLSPTACNPTSLPSVLFTQLGVVAYVPNGDWDISAVTTGVQVVPIEPAGTPATIATPNIVNSCASNSITGQTVCTANNTDVYLISGTSLNATLTSGSNGTTDFSGGNCYNCGVAIESNSNTAVIGMGLSGSPSGSGLQFLNLNNNTFSTPVPTNYEISEDVLWDPIRNLIVSPGEDGVYDLFQMQSGSLTEYGNNIGGTLDSAGEDCITGVGLSTDEYTSNIVLTDLTQATYTPGSPGTWSAPLQFQYIPEWDPYDGAESGTDGISVATGTHLGIMTGEYPFPPRAANAVMVFQLPSTSGSGMPSLQDYAVATMPNDPMGYPFSMGCDPHTVTAYVSPVSGKSTGLLIDYGPVTCYSGGMPQYVALVDLQGMLNAPRTGAHTVDPTYDLVANQIVTFVATY